MGENLSLECWKICGTLQGCLLSSMLFFLTQRAFCPSKYLYKAYSAPELRWCAKWELLVGQEAELNASKGYQQMNIAKDDSENSKIFAADFWTEQHTYTPNMS